MKAIILAGGTGTRLWPMSREKKPKQFFELVGNEPLIKDTYRRLLRMFPEEKIYFSISAPLAELLLQYFPDWPAERLIIEPEKRDTGPAMGYVAARFELDDPDEPMVFVPADHYIGDEKKFLQCLAAADRLIQETGKMLDIGVAPAFPSTVLGYTKIAGLFKEEDGIEIFNFSSHTEKPIFEVAKKYLEDGSYLWHASYYMWTPRKFMEAFETYAPDAGVVLREIQTVCRSEWPFAPTNNSINGLYSQLPKKSFDYLITEKMNPAEVLIIKGNFGWSDIGAWDTLYDRLSTDEKANVCKGRNILLETEGSLIYAPENKTVAVLGMKDVIVVDTGDALLVCPKNQAQQVKEIISELQNKNQHDVL